MVRHRLDGRKFRYDKKMVNEREERYEYSSNTLFTMAAPPSLFHSFGTGTVSFLPTVFCIVCPTFTMRTPAVVWF